MRDARPARLRGGPGAGVTGGDGGLEHVRASLTARRRRPIERGEPTTDEELVPERAVLIEEQDGLARRAQTRPRARRLDLHQRDQAVGLGLVRDELGQDAPETKR